MRRLFLVAVPAALALTGCPASVNGEIDGESVPALMSAYFTQITTGEGDFESTTVGATGLSLLDGCNGSAKRVDNTNILLEDNIDALKDAENQDDVDDANAEFAQARVEYDEQNLPSDYWSAIISLNAADDGDFDGAESDIDFEDPDPDQDVLAGVSICRVNDFPSEDDGVFEEDADCWTAVKGTVTVNLFENEQTVQVTAEVTLVDSEDVADGDLDKDVGDVTVTINAGFCEPLQAAFEDQQDILEDAAGG